MKNIITSEWIQPQGLKHLVATFHNIGVLLYRNKQIKEVFFLFLMLYILLMFLLYVPFVLS